MKKRHWNQQEPPLGGEEAGGNEIDDAVRTIARHLGKHSDQSLLIVVDADGSWVYAWISPDVLSAARDFADSLHQMLTHRKLIRAKSIGTEKG